MHAVLTNINPFSRSTPAKLKAITEVLDLYKETLFIKGGTNNIVPQNAYITSLLKGHINRKAYWRMHKNVLSPAEEQFAAELFKISKDKNREAAPLHTLTHFIVSLAEAINADVQIELEPLNNIGLFHKLPDATQEQIEVFLPRLKEHLHYYNEKTSYPKVDVTFFSLMMFRYYVKREYSRVATFHNAPTHRLTRQNTIIQAVEGSTESSYDAIQSAVNNMQLLKTEGYEFITTPQDQMMFLKLQNTD